MTLRNVPDPRVSHKLNLQELAVKPFKDSSLAVLEYLGRFSKSMDTRNWCPSVALQNSLSVIFMDQSAWTQVNWKIQTDKQTNIFELIKPKDRTPEKHSDLQRIITTLYVEPNYLANNLSHGKYKILELNNSYSLKGERGFFEFQGLKIWSSYLLLLFNWVDITDRIFF